jgi:oligoendopeptidase F
MWLEMERIYMPWRQWGDLANEASGRFWQGQLHIYVHPFYYIDYTLALTCALQLWTLAREDWQEAMQRYVQLCRRGGEAPFQQLVAAAGLRSPFADGCLTDVVDAARRALEIA